MPSIRFGRLRLFINLLYRSAPTGCKWADRIVTQNPLFNYKISKLNFYHRIQVEDKNTFGARIAKLSNIASLSRSYLELKVLLNH